MKKIIVYSDPGHAWAAVQRAELRQLGIEHQISSYSYQRGKTAYLEEDCDLGAYLAAIKAAGQPVQFVEKHTDKRSPIRSYATFKQEPQQ